MVRQIGTEQDPAKRIRQRQGKTLRQIREMRGLSMEELASKVGVTDGAVSQWETGRFSPRQHHQVSLARALDVPWSTIFGLDGEVA